MHDISVLDKIGRTSLRAAAGDGGATFQVVGNTDHRLACEERCSRCYVNGDGTVMIKLFDRRP